ncbi:MAG: hypothetical protein ACRDKL_11325, partial [Solirubrobacteraceae bacterium]
MNNEPTDTEPTDPARMDPSILRGLSMGRLSRRDLLRGAGALGVAAMFDAYGAGGALAAKRTHRGSSAVGSPAWWRKQKLNHKLNFGNWPLYIDEIHGKSLSLEHLTATTGIQVN